MLNEHVAFFSKSLTPFVRENRASLLFYMRGKAIEPTDFKIGALSITTNNPLKVGKNLISGSCNFLWENVERPATSKFDCSVIIAVDSEGNKVVSEIVDNRININR